MKLPLRDNVFAIVDRDCPGWIHRQKWSLTVKQGRSYAYRTKPKSGGRKHELLHRLIVLAKPGEEVDHINGDTLDNRRKNLRRCSHAQNSQNLRKWSSPTASIFKGVSLHSCGSWRAYIAPRGRQIHLGYFGSEQAAAKAYDRAARHYFGQYAKTNF